MNDLGRRRGIPRDRLALFLQHFSIQTNARLVIYPLADVLLLVTCLRKRHLGREPSRLSAPLPGIEASPSFDREPEGNGVAERFIRTLEENLLWVRAFRTIEELTVALVEFADRYKRTWLFARQGYGTPDQVRAEQLSVAKANIAELPLAA
jgi:hypothetical protein